MTHSKIPFSIQLTPSQAGLNLNVFGALSGAFSSKSKKETAEDGSSTEERQEQLSGSGMHEQLPGHLAREYGLLMDGAGAGAGNLNANAAASAEQKARQMRAAIEEKNQS